MTRPTTCSNPMPGMVARCGADLTGGRVAGGGCGEVPTVLRTTDQCLDRLATTFPRPCRTIVRHAPHPTCTVGEMARHVDRRAVAEAGLAGAICRLLTLRPDSEHQRHEAEQAIVEMSAKVTRLGGDPEAVRRQAEERIADQAAQVRDWR